MRDSFKSYKNFISLGANCYVAEDLIALGLRDFSYPFDWCFSDDFSGVIDAIENSFNGFVDYDFLLQHKSNPTRYFNAKYRLSFYHDFNKFLPLKKQIDEVSKKYHRRINRFYETIQKPTIFFRYIISENDYVFLKKEYVRIENLLKSFCPENRIIYIVHNDSLKDLGVEYFYVTKDENNWITRTPLRKSEKLHRLLKDINDIDKNRNIVFASNKKPLKQKFNFERVLRRAFNVEYKHKNTCDL